MMPWTKETYAKMQWLPIAMGITAVYTFGQTPSADLLCKLTSGLTLSCSFQDVRLILYYVESVAG